KTLALASLDAKGVSLEKTTIKTHVKPKYLSFDIECYSKNHNSKLPNPRIPENVVNQISMIFGKLGDVKSRRRILLSLGNPEYVENCDTLLIFKSEKELLLEFPKIVMSENPDVFIGYNIMKFDWDYMLVR